MEQNDSQILGISGDSEKGAAHSGAVHPDSLAPPPDLALLIDRWPTLPDAVRAQIVSLVESSS